MAAGTTCFMITDFTSRLSRHQSSCASHLSFFILFPRFWMTDYTVVVLCRPEKRDKRFFSFFEIKSFKKFCFLPLSGPVLTAPSSRCRLGISLRLSMSTGAAAAAPTPKDEPARRSEIFQNLFIRLKVQIPPRQTCECQENKFNQPVLCHVQTSQTFTGC